MRDVTGNKTTGFLPEDAFTMPNKFILTNKSYNKKSQLASDLKFLRAGPRKEIVYQPSKVRAAIATCGGLCPGLNVVVREIVMCLFYNYGVKEIFGVKWGFQGFTKKDCIFPLNTDVVKYIHKIGGSYLGSSRGGFDAQKIIEKCVEKGINHLYIIGGDGTHRAIYKLYEYTVEHNIPITICGVPKTIDNDIPLIDKSFGFDTACEVAREIIEAANCEAESAENGVGLVKLMGRDSGAIAATATLASRDVNICLIPESPFEIEGEYGLCETVYKRLKKRSHCVIVVAEGADDAIIDAALEKGKSVDGGGHRKHGDIGVYLKERIVSYAKEKYNMEITLKYIDPTYTIRSVRSNASDTVLCTKLAQNSVHAAMAGYTGFSIGQVRDTAAIIPIKCLNESAKRRVDIYERTWHRVLASTGQPQMVSPKNMEYVTSRAHALQDEVKNKKSLLVQEQDMMFGMIKEEHEEEDHAQHYDFAS